MLQGALQDVRLITGPHGYLNQCPHLDTSCPTCGEYTLLQNTVEQLTRHLQELSQRVSTVSYTHLPLQFRDVCKKLFDSVWICSCYRLP